MTGVTSWTGAVLALALLGTAPSAAQDDAPSPPSDRLVIGEVRLAGDDVFTSAEVERARGPVRLLRRAMNALHVDTAAWVIREELLFRPGDPLDPTRLEETARNLRQLGILADVAVVAVDTSAEGRVAVEVRYRESWTLATGVSFAVASDGAARGNVSLTERNFLGQAVTVQTLLGRDADATYGRLYFRQDRLLRSRVSLELNAEERSFGFDRWARIALPFRADEQAWTAEARGWTDEKEVRWYLSRAALAGHDPREEASLHALLPRATWGLEARAGRRLSAPDRGRVWRAGAGVEFEVRDYALGRGLFELSDDTVADLAGLDDPGTVMARAEGRRTWPYLWLTGHGRRWAAGRYVLQYGSHEDVPLDPRLDLRAGPALPRRGWRVVADAQDWSRLGAGFAFLGASTVVNAGGDAPRSAVVGAVGGIVLRHGDGERPWLTRAVVEAARGWRLPGDEALVLGLDRGLRTLSLDGMAGERLARWNVEHGRPLPAVLFGIFQAGWAAFYDGGLARFADEDRDLGDARHEVGVGLRFGSVRTSSADLARLDLSWPLDGGGPVLTTVARGFF